MEKPCNICGGTKPSVPLPSTADTAAPVGVAETAAPVGAEEQRRRFLAKVIALTTGAIALAVPTVVGLLAFLNPLRQKSDAGAFMEIATLPLLPDDGSPRAFPIIADRNDGWNRFPNQPIGSIFLRRTEDKKRPVAALQVVCPHAGCSIKYEAATAKFFCPCHAASFDLAGARTDKTSPSPRDMDTLEVEIRNKTEVWVKFENFLVGTSEKIAEV